MGRLRYETDFGFSQEKIFGIGRTNAEGDVQGHDGIPLFTTLSLLSFVSFVRLAISSVPKPGTVALWHCTMYIEEHCRRCRNASVVCTMACYAWQDSKQGLTLAMVV